MPQTRFTTANVVAAFWAHGAEPTFTSYTGPSQRLTFLCSCPESRPGETTFRALHYQGVIPQCAECRTIARQDRMRANRRVSAASTSPEAAPRTDRGEVIAEKYRLLFAQHGVTPLSDYEDAKAPIYFVCSGRECGGARHEIMPAALRKGQVPRCPSCQKASRPRGEGHYRFDPRRTAEQRARDRSAADKAWEVAVLREASNICVVTGRIGRAPHHLYGHAGFPELRLLRQNGVCLTRRLHDEFTARHRAGRNTHADFVAFYEKKTGRPCPILDPMLLTLSERVYID